MTSIIKTTCAELPDKLEQFDNDPEAYEDMPQHIIRNKRIGQDQIITYGPLFAIKDLGLCAIEGTYCNYDPATDEYEPDFSLTIIYKTTRPDRINFDRYVMFEQDSPMTAIHNYLTYMERRQQAGLLCSTQTNNETCQDNTAVLSRLQSKPHLEIAFCERSECNGWNMHGTNHVTARCN